MGDGLKPTIILQNGKNKLLSDLRTTDDPDCFYIAPLILYQEERWGKRERYFLLYFFYLVCEAIGTAATPGLLCQPRVIMKMTVEKQMQCRLAGETEVLGENLPQCHFWPSQNST
jgi:hypothetical protein